MAHDRQPKELYSLFLTELWERFGFYTIQTILILYLSKGLNYPDHKAYLLFGAFNSMLYLTPFVGGYLADKYLGFQRSIVLGGAFLCLGYFLMALPTTTNFFLGMSVVIIGNGLFKPNVSSLVGTLYTPQDPRRNGGFTLFYMGINIGAMLPPLFIGAFVAAYTWGSGFGLASIGMAIALITFISSWEKYKKGGAIPKSSPLLRKKSKQFYLIFSTGILILIAFFHLLFTYPEIADFFLVTASLAIIGTVLFFLFKESPEQRRKLWAALILILVSIGFWAIYMQSFSSLMLFAQRNMHKEIFGISINPEFTLFFNPLFIIAMSPFFSRLWLKLGKKRQGPSTPMKFSLGILFMAIGFFVLWIGVRYNHDGGMVSPWWLILSYFIQTIGELLLSPIGLAMITLLAPKRLAGMMMGVWFLTLAASFAIGGAIATIADVPKGASVLQSIHIYDHAFLIFGILGTLLAILSFALTPYLHRLIKAPSVPIKTPKE